MAMDHGDSWSSWDEVLGREEADALEVLSAAAMYERYFQAVQRRAVAAARATGSSWQDIAQAAGVTKQTAWEKWRSPRDPAAERRRPEENVGPVTGKLARFWTSPDAAVPPPGSSPETPVDIERTYRPYAAQFVDSWCGRDDPHRAELLEAAWTGLEHAVASYALPERRVPFSLYATWWMRQAVTRLVNELRAQ